MKAICLFDQKDIKPSTARQSSGSTAYYIFDRANLHPFMVDLVHLRMKTGASEVPIVYNGSRRGLQQTLDQLVPVSGTIIDMSDYYRDGASLKIENPSVARTVYGHILRHLSAHLNAMRTDPAYELPEDNTLEELAEFGSAIYPWTVDGKDKLPPVDNYITRLQNARPFISFDKPVVQPVNDPTTEVPSVIKQMDAIQQYIAMNQLR